MIITCKGYLREGEWIEEVQCAPTPAIAEAIKNMSAEWRFLRFVGYLDDNLNFTLVHVDVMINETTIAHDLDPSDIQEMYYIAGLPKCINLIKF